MVSGHRISFMAMVNFTSKMAHITREPSDMVLPKDKVATYLTMAVCMRARSIIMWPVEMDCISILSRIISIVGNGKMTLFMVLGRRSFKMDHIMKVIMSKEQSKVMDIMCVSQESMRDNSKQVHLVARVFSLTQMEECIKVNGQMVSLLDMAYSHGLMVTDMKDSTKMDTNKARGHFFSAMGRSSEVGGCEA